MDIRHRLELIGITYNQIEAGVYALILQQVGGTRRIPIIIGYPEAQAIQCKLQNVVPPRPFCHDIMLSSLHAFGVSLIEVEIKKLSNGVFAANLLLSDGYNNKIIDARSSDAIALAIRVGAPIYTSDTVLMEAGFEPKSKAGQPTHKTEEANIIEEGSHHDDDLDKFSIESLNEKMMLAVEKEDYEEAARIKKEIEKRNTNKNEKS